MQKALLIVLLTVLMAPLLPKLVRAQTDPTLVGTCSTGIAETYLDIGNVRANLANNGSLFYTSSRYRYEVPKGSGVGSIYATGLWIGGYINEELRIASSTFSARDFWPGPIKDIQKPPTDCSQLDKIWTLNQGSDNSNFELGEPPTQAELVWPVDLGAPFEEIDGIPGYSPYTGDRPTMLGEQMHWWVMNDIGNVHTRTRTNPLGVEVQVSAFAFSVPIIENVTFYRYHIINKNAEPISDMRVGNFSDVDLALASNDFVGTDSVLSLVYVYNGNDDELDYGIAHSAVGFTIIEARHSKGGLPSNSTSEPDFGDYLTNSISYWNAAYFSHPDEGIEVYRYLNSTWPTGQFQTIGGDGEGFSNIKSRFIYPGDPVTYSFWSSNNSDGVGGTVHPGNVNIVGSYGPFDLGPGESATFTFAFVWAQGKDNLDSVTQLRTLTKQVHLAKHDLLSPSLPPSPKFIDGNPPETPQYSFWMDPVFPNPAQDKATINYSLTLDGNTTIAVFDALSRQVATVNEGLQAAGRHTLTLNTTSLHPGVYTVRLQSNRDSTTRLLTVVR